MPKKKHPKPWMLLNGAKRDRTDDLLTASQALSQLSYSPITACCSSLLPNRLNGGGLYRTADRRARLFYKKNNIFHLKTFASENKWFGMKFVKNNCMLFASVHRP